LPIESLLMRATDVVLCLPALLIAIALAAVIGPSMVFAAMITAALPWTTVARIVDRHLRTMAAGLPGG
jgi:peptide/nickel transport system permease protein